MSIDRSLEEALVLDRDGYPYIVHPLTDGVPRVSAGLLIEWMEWAGEQTTILADATVLLAPEAMALPLAAAVSLRTGLPYLVVRKREYGLEGETLAYCETGYSQTCLYLNGLGPGDRVVVVDDVVSTGGTLQGILATLKELKINVQGCLVFLDKGGKATALAEQNEVPVAVMRAVEVTEGRVQVRPQP